MYFLFHNHTVKNIINTLCTVKSTSKEVKSKVSQIMCEYLPDHTHFALPPPNGHSTNGHQSGINQDTTRFQFGTIVESLWYLS